jgi:hypothetical protein
MAKVLIAGLTALSCVHPFPIPATGSARLTVGSTGVLTRSVVLNTAPNCPRAIDSQGPPVIKHCTKVLTMSGATKLTVGNDPVVLDSEQGTTDGVLNPPYVPPVNPPVIAKPLQTKLTAT